MGTRRNRARHHPQVESVDIGNSAGALPFTVILDRSGAIAYRKLGLLKAQELEGTLGRLVG